MLEVEFLDIAPQPIAFSVTIPGMGFSTTYHNPFVARWRIGDGWATSAEMGVRIPGAPFMGIPEVAPFTQKLKEWTCASSARRMPVPCWSRWAASSRLQPSAGRDASTISAKSASRRPQDRDGWSISACGRVNAAGKRWLCVGSLFACLHVYMTWP
jgi:acetamidase/formamidase